MLLLIFFSEISKIVSWSDDCNTKIRGEGLINIYKVLSFDVENASFHPP